LHWVAIARAAGWQLEWADFDALSAAVPLLARVYPNGAADVNDLHAAGGTAYLFKELLDAGLMWHTTNTVNTGNSVQTPEQQGLRGFTHVPYMQNATTLAYKPCSDTSLDLGVLRPVSQPFQPDGGLKMLRGNLGHAVVKVSAVAPEYRSITAPCAVFESQEAVLAAFQAGDLNRDIIVVVRGQGPKACGMPELHKLTPALSVLQDKGYRVALLTDGRMSGASGKVLSAIHVTPEAVAGGAIAQLHSGDVITVDAINGVFNVESNVESNVEFNVEFNVELNGVLSPTALESFLARPAVHIAPTTVGIGREMFAVFRNAVTPADQGATVLEF
jgi:phosphogluconate dehydratase